MEKEFNGLLARDYGTLVPRSEAAGYQIYPTRWIYTAKDAYTAKARQVVLGNLQADDHYYSPTATSASFRTFVK
jgi:hypothetical protein